MVTAPTLVSDGDRFVNDSALEEDGFEPSVPRGMGLRYSTGILGGGLVGAHTRANPGVLDRLRRDLHETPTLRWRGLDSNF